MKRLEAMNGKLQRKDIWQEFMKRKSVIGELFKEKLSKYNSVALLRNEMLEALVKTAANNIQIGMNKKEKSIRRSRIYLKSTYKMWSSIDENSPAEILYTNQEETFIE
jgi:hypothetical protein